MEHQKKWEPPQGFEWDLKLQVGEEADGLTKKIWPRYLIEDSDVSEPLPPTNLSDQELDRRFLAWGIRNSQNKKLVAYASALLVPMDLSKKDLPDGGWRAASNAYFSDTEPNCVCLLSANIDPDYRNQKFSYSLIEKSKELAKDLDLNTIIAPVRPSHKEKFLELSIQDYLEKKSDFGEIFDPWLRTHLNLGGVLLNVCSQSIVVTASLSKWREWTSQEFLKSGPYQLPMGLTPLMVDAVTNVGTYTEPNVWVRYDLK